MIKKLIASLFILIMVFTLTSCKAKSIGLGTYVLTEDSAGVGIALPSITIQEDNKFNFTFSVTSSYIGTYEIIEDELYLQASGDEQMWVFTIENLNSIIYNAEKSDGSIWFSNIVDGSKFILIEAAYDNKTGNGEYYDLVPLSSYARSGGDYPNVYNLIEIPEPFAARLRDADVKHYPLYHIIDSYSELKAMFETASNLKVENFFKENLYDNYFVLAVFRDEVTIVYNNYANFRLNKGDIQIDIFTTDNSSEALSMHLDFVIIPNSELN